LGALGGSTLGGFVGQPAAGSAVGSSLGAAVSKWLGAGDYEVSQNSIVAKASSNIPAMHKSDQSVTIRHKEFIGPIHGSTGFQMQYNLPINPGVTATFPWLATIARRFQEYKVKGMVFHYVPTSGTAISSTNSALGTVMIQTSYRAGDSAPTSKVSLLNEYWSNEVVPYDCMAHPIECDPKENPFSIHYVRAGTTPSAEPLLYDLGNTFVATEGMQGTNIVGDLWVTYEIEFKKPVVSTNVSLHSNYLAGNFDQPSSTQLYDNGGPGPTIGTLEGLTFAGKTITIPKTYSGIFTIHLHVTTTTALGSTVEVAWKGAPTLANCSLYDAILGGENPWTFRISSSIANNETADYSCSVVKDPGTVATITTPDIIYATGVTEKVYFAIYRFDTA
jgi:hypothetical protein